MVFTLNMLDLIGCRVGRTHYQLGKACWKSSMLLDMLSLSRVRSISLYHSGKDFGYALRMDAAPEAMQLLKSRMRKRG